MSKREDMQKIIDDNLDAIINLVKAGLPRSEQEPDYVIMRELRIYFSSPKAWGT